MSILTITGNNSFLRSKDIRQSVKKFVDEHGDMALEKIDGEESTYDRIRESLESLPFLSPNKLVVLRSPSAQPQFTENAEVLLKNLPESVELIIHEPKLDKRTSYAKVLKKLTEFHEHNDLDGNGLINWLVTPQSKEASSQLGRAEAAHLLAKIGPKQQLLSTELEKLKSTGKKIDKQLIDQLVEPLPQSSIFDLLETAFAGNKKHMIKLYKEQRQQNVEPQAIIGLLAWQLHIIAVCVMAENKSSSQIASDAKLNPYVVSKSMSLARNISKTEIKDYINRLSDLDHQIKTSATNADDALLAYLLAL